MAGRSPAALRHRVFAVLIDGGVSAGVLAVASGAVVTASVVFSASVVLLAPVVALAGAAWFLVQTAMQGGQGSIGMRLMGIKLAHAGDDAPLGFGRALGRNLVWGITGGMVVGWFSPLFDPSPWRRGWHDLAVGAVMADAVPSRPAAPVAAPVAEPVVAAPAVGPAAPAFAAPVPAQPAPVIEHVSPVAKRMPPAPIVERIAPAAAPIAVAPAAVAAPVLAPAAPAAQPIPASWAPVVRAPQRVPRTLPVDVISTVPGAESPRGIRPADPSTPMPATLAMLVWDDGTRHTVFDATLFGRSPAGEPGKRLTAVRDETLSISKTHFEIGADGQSAWVLDRYSLNGVILTRGGVPQRLVPGEPARLWPGDVLDVGDRRVTVESAR